MKSGRTWLRVMLAKVIAESYGVDKLDLDLVRMAFNRSDIPKIAFTHSQPGIGIYVIDLRRMRFSGVYSKSGKVAIRSSLKKKKIVLLVRDPRDVIVSLFFELKKRRRLYDGNISQFVREKYTLKKIIDFMNMWYVESERRRNDFLIVKYEELKSDTLGQVRRVVDFLGLKASEEVLARAIKYGSFDNMKKLEKSNTFIDTRLSARNLKDKESYKVRKGKVGGFTENLDPLSINYINAMIDKELVKAFNY